MTTLASGDSCVVESRLDWLTVTQTVRDSNSSLRLLGEQLLPLAVADEGQPKIWHWHDYIGTHCGWLTFGTREDSDILQVSGPQAESVLDLVAPCATRCTRLDLCVTGYLPNVTEDIAHECHSSGLKWAEGRANPPGYTYITNSAGGRTCYIGSRTSDVFGRVYNKEAESGLPEYSGCWRWEVECKGDVADRTFTRYCGAPNRALMATELVSNYFIRRGVQPRFRVFNSGLRLRTIRPRTDLASRLHWLASQVAPAVRKLCAAGYESQVLQALELPYSAYHTGPTYNATPYDSHHDELLENEGDDNG